jgi:hypothetical protein
MTLAMADSRDRASSPPWLGSDRQAGSNNGPAVKLGLLTQPRPSPRPASRILEGDDPSFVPSGRWNLPRHEVEWCFDDG